MTQQNTVPKNFSYQIFDSTKDLPKSWDEVAESNIFLQTRYLHILQEAAPENMRCSFIGIFNEKELIATSIIQFISLEKLNSFGNRDHCLKTKIKNLLFKRFSSKLLIIGNNMLSGQHAYAISSKADESVVLNILKKIANEWPQKAHIKLIKDFNHSVNLQVKSFEKDYKFTTQPSMIFSIRPQWKHENDYVQDLHKKYRDQFKRGRKKGKDIISKEFSLADIKENEEALHSLYLQVAQHAPVNTFFLPKNHFYSFKKYLKEDFILRAYYLHDQIIGFTTVIRHGKVLETYFLGYNESVQRNHMLYLNMLYDIIACGINQSFSQIIFGRTALEIKSSIGAEPHELFGYMRHANSLIHANLSWIFPLLEPNIEWNKRSPFKFQQQTSQLSIPHLDEAIKKKQGSLCQFFGS